MIRAAQVRVLFDLRMGLFFQWISLKEVSYESGKPGNQRANLQWRRKVN
jgi:hypothetical protein